MNYNLLCGAWGGYDADGVDARWVLWNNRDGTSQDNLPLLAGWATPTIYLFNPGDPRWQHCLIGQESEAFAAYPFDGWQMDQVGDRGTKYDANGQPVNVWKTFRPFLDAPKTALSRKIIFNNVGGYGLFDTAAHTDVDPVYIECGEWSGQKTYGDLKTLIDQASSWSHGKAVVLTAYVSKRYADRFAGRPLGRFNTPGVLLADAAIFAAGGTHLEIGDGSQLLDSEYFPNHNSIQSNALQTALRGYYDFQVAYENLLCGGLIGSSDAVSLRVPFSPDAAPDTVWAFAKTGPGHQVMHLINLIGEHRNDWRDAGGDEPSPTVQKDIVLTYHKGTDSVRQAVWASPDAADIALHPLPFTTGRDAGGAYIRFTVPRLACWDMVCLTTAETPFVPGTIHD